HWPNWPLRIASTWCCSVIPSRPVLMDGPVRTRPVSRWRRALSRRCDPEAIPIFSGPWDKETPGSGQIDTVIMRIMDMLTAIPATLLALSIVAALGASMTNLLIAITISSIPGFVRLIRSVVITVVESDYVEAARACGTSDVRIIYKHILPNAIGIIVIQTTSSISGMILQAAGLSFIGMGVQPPQPEWGAMLSEAREFMRISPIMLIVPGVCIILTALSFNLVGDGLRDALDPRLKD
ncbi:MAG: ABC transporter permease, partial [Clostridia bacterium]|nr:ABC transporter permease [Clostridia bacterium]